MSVLNLVKPLLDITRRHRRVWQTEGRVHIELREIPHPADFAVALCDELHRHPAVSWAEVLDRPGRVVISYDPQGARVDELVALIDQVEQALGFDDHPLGMNRPDHPADPEPVIRSVVALAADVGGLGLAVFGRARRWRALPVEVDTAAVFALLQGVPRLRGPLERRLTAPVAEVGLAVANGLLAGLAQGPLGPVVDIAHRVDLLTEAEARRRTWEAREAELCGKPSGHPVRTLVPEARAAPLRNGPVERYQDRAWLASLGGFGAAVALTRSLDRASAALLAGLPKAAHQGRESFAAHLGRLLARRRVVILDPTVLRRLDRIDVLVLEEGLLLADRLELGRLAVRSGLEPAQARRLAAAMFDPGDPQACQRDGSWSLAPSGDDPGVLALSHHEHVEATIELRPRLDEQGLALVASGRRAGLRVLVSTADPEWADGADLDGTVGVGNELAEAVRALQADGSGVLVVATGSSPGLEVADCGVGLRRTGDPPAWDAHLVCDDDLTEAWLVVEAVDVSRRVSERSTNLALFGATAGVFLTFGGILPGTNQRVTTAINIATMLAMADGTRAGLALATRPRPFPRDLVPWHALEVPAVMNRLGSTTDGLPEEVRRERRIEPSRPLPVPLGVGRAVLDEVLNPLTPVLAVGAGLSLAVGSVSDALLVTSVVGLNALIGGAQRFRTERAVARLGRRERSLIRVRRPGRVEEVFADELVPGDVVLLDAGEAVPADCRLLEAEMLQTDESSLTGESLPVDKSVAPIRSDVIAERSSMLYEGTSIAAGRAVTVVVATGDDTEARRGVLLAGDRAPTTGVEERLSALTRTVTPVSVGAGLGVMGLGLLRGIPMTRTAGAGVSLAVAAVPEGLPLLATVAQMSSARRLSRRGALVRNPRAIEALGRVDLLCADKTGTLTEGRIRVQLLSDGASAPTLEEADEQHLAILAAALRATPGPGGHGKLPHPTDRALIHASEDTGVGATTGTPGWSRGIELPFEPGRAYHATLGWRDGDPLLTVKGAPESLLPRCRRWFGPAGETSVGAAERAELLTYMEGLARSGLRILAVAERELESTATGLVEDDVDDLTLLGFVGLRDPVRPSAVDAVAGVRAAGVRVLMLTGDHPSTAEGIAAELGLLDGTAILTGPEIDELPDDDLADRLETATVCARVTPAHKVRIVRVLQDRGHAVAMTGDGANDAPAIRMADVGVALGTRATSAARDAADLVVVDDRIETIVDAIGEGRTMWAAVRDAVSVLVGGNLGEIGFTVLGSAVTGAPPLGARQLLLVNLLTDIVPAMAIAVRPPADRTIQSLIEEGPDRSLGQALNRSIAVRAVATAAGASGAYLTARLTGTPGRARSVALVALVGSQLGQTLATGGRSPTVVAAGAGSFAVLAGIVQTPGVSRLFGCRPLGPVGWATALGWAGVATVGSVVLPSQLDRLPEPWLAKVGLASVVEPQPPLATG